MSAIRSALDEMLAVDDSGLSDEELAADVAELSYLGQMVEVLRARKVKNLADRGGHHTLGYSSPTAFLVDQTRMSPGHARRVVGYGNAAEKAPHAHAAWADGRLSTDQATHLFRAAEAVPDEYPDAEAALVDIVEGLDAVDTAKAVAYWRQAMEGPGELDAGIQQARRRLSASWTLDGMLKVDGWLTTTAGEAFIASLDANTPPRRDDDTRTPRQRRHDALENLCRDWLDNGTTPTVGGEKPHLVLHTDLPALQGVAGGLHETENGEIVDVEMLRMIACDASVTRIVFGPDSEILDVGRKTRCGLRRNDGPSPPATATAKDQDAGPNHATATFTTPTTGPVEAPRQSTKASSTADPATSNNTSKTATTDTDHEPRGGPFPTTPDPERNPDDDREVPHHAEVMHRTTEELQSRLDDILATPKDAGIAYPGRRSHRRDLRSPHNACFKFAGRFGKEALRFANVSDRITKV